MSELVLIVQPLLVPDEKIEAYQDSLLFDFYWVPHWNPMLYSNTPRRLGGVVLTNKRLIFFSQMNDEDYFYSTTSIISLSERLFGVKSRNTVQRFQGYKSEWPYQATIMMPGGLIMVIETEKKNMEESGNYLSKLLTKGLLLLGKNNLDNDSMAAILAYEEQKRREEESRYYYDKKDKDK